MGEELARVSVDERVEAGGGRQVDEGGELDGVLGGRSRRRWGPARNQREEGDRSEPNDQRTTFTHANRLFFEPTRSK